MPIHDWTRVSPGTFHDFHNAWIVELRNVLNGGLLPAGYYAQSEQSVGNVVPDVLTLQAEEPNSPSSSRQPAGTIAVAEAPPKVSVVMTAEAEVSARRRRTLTIRHTSDDRVIAMIEILSWGNKSHRAALDAFLDKAVAAIRQHCHLLIVDLYPPGAHDPDGIHGAVWAQVEDSQYEAPTDRPLTLAAYSAGFVPCAYVEPIGVGYELPEMPLFLDADWYVKVPLESTYNAAYRGVPDRWKRVIENHESTHS